MDRNECITAIRAALKRRSLKRWSVRGGSGTAWGWITISALPGRMESVGTMSAADCAELAGLLGLPSVHPQGVDIPASSAYRQEYVDRANGTAPTVCGSPYWD